MTPPDLLDAAFAMPPMQSWFRGPEAIGAFLAASPLSGEWRWRAVRARANGQEALAFYSWSPDAQAYERFALNVLSFDEERRISAVDAFIARSTENPDPAALARLPEQAFDPGWLDLAFERLGLPAELRD